MKKIKGLFSKTPKTLPNWDNDPEYQKALKDLHGLEFETKDIIKSIEFYQKQVELLTSSCVKLTEDVNCWFADAPLKSKDIIVADTRIIRRFDALTSNTLSQGIESYVIGPLTKFQQDIDEAHSLLKERNLASKNCQGEHEKFEQKLKKSSDALKISEAQHKYDEAKKSFNQINRHFIDFVAD